MAKTKAKMGSGKGAYERHRLRQLRIKWVFYGSITIVLLVLLGMILFIES